MHDGSLLSHRTCLPVFLVAPSECYLLHCCWSTAYLAPRLECRALPHSPSSGWPHFSPNIRNYLGSFSEYGEWICTYTENTRNESVRILEIFRKNLYIYREYVERGKSSNKILLFVYWEFAEWLCSYTENMWNWSVCILRIRGMHKKSNISANSIWNQNQKYFTFIWSIDGFIWPNNLKPKNLMQVYL